MASPQRKFPAEANLSSALQPEHPERPTAPRQQPSPRRRRLGYLGILFFLVVAFWYVGFGWGSSGGWIWGHRDAPAAAGNQGELSGSGLVILEVANKQDYVGQSFQIENVAVDHWSGDRAVWIGSRHSYLPMLLVFPSASSLAPKAVDTTNSAPPPASEDEAAPVQRLDVTGTIVKAPPLAQAQQQWKLSDEDVDQLEEEGVYIQATTVQPAKH